MTPNSNNVLLDFQQPSSTGHNDPDENETGAPQDSNLQMPPGRQDIVSILLQRISRRRRTFEDITKSTKQVNVLEANASGKRIYCKWCSGKWCILHCF
jgi:hypothetical protein